MLFIVGLRANTRGLFQLWSNSLVEPHALVRLGALLWETLIGSAAGRAPSIPKPLVLAAIMAIEPLERLDRQHSAATGARFFLHMLIIPYFCFGGGPSCSSTMCRVTMSSPSRPVSSVRASLGM